MSPRAIPAHDQVIRTGAAGDAIDPAISKVSSKGASALGSQRRRH